MESLLALFDSLTQHLRQLTELAKRKTTVVRKNDLVELDKILKEEQAQSLALRGLEQKRITLLQHLGLENVPLTELSAKAPSHLQQKTRDTVDTLRREFSIYRSAAEIARNTLECTLLEVEKFLAAAGAADKIGEVDPTPQMNSDFRALSAPLSTLRSVNHELYRNLWNVYNGASGYLYLPAGSEPHR